MGDATILVEFSIIYTNLSFKKNLIIRAEVPIKNT